MADRMDVLATIMADMVANKKAYSETQERRAKLMPTFENEEEALKYARRVAALRPGDTAKILNEDDTAFRPAVFIGIVANFAPRFLIFDSGTKRLAQASTSWHAVVVD